MVLELRSVRYRVGVDVGSTTVKAVVMDARTDAVLWKDYRRHETRQAEMLLDFLRRMEAEAGDRSGQLPRLRDRLRRQHPGGPDRRQVRPGGAGRLSDGGAALSPRPPSIVEIGGQDAKIVILKKDPDSGRIKKIPSMNDKCAGGTGAVIDKISAKLGISPQTLSRAALCGNPPAPGRRQVRSLCRDRHQRPAEAGDSARRN